ncbi:hypothetical protein E6P09_10520 [Haloferax mediterranei ATCC 33500]|uniref:Uncharacterized protein n=1 Tax=Haloferax mediterranei (strain ATCC 33500 / DSM 1411 / JCM 8866 / NBRC 14739 / NCIMB 2177 / R-4) TaxID=523841 RepID=I3R4P5_HALMT|nr:hypothetical protein [Haloferax mediterranei]AFK19205.2 hypothetical protein HFX_1497 [Haloferax mediterranei ATCC 33500]AHZ21431.1 hypothetical protein BM92_01650 [Haloferax mediterranei ATCC 33500]EMA03889.1 hypothetical protein C439_02988 [Haloferax mediterranei ATCC 33500]MDX5989307.1 hypothetical protein [Haloferax mediterranei ATCC 33500]QCQ75674.1 hypothetical protein E6P09_10520 [Haloferax mediterranei ATCC 33500]
MKGEVEFSELEKKTPFTTALRGRVIPAGNIYDPEHDNEELPDFTQGEDWLNFVPDAEGNLRFYKGEPISGVYFGKEPANPETDLNNTFVELYYQRLSFPHIAGLVPSLLDDLRNLATVLSKMAHYQSNIPSGSWAIQRFIQTELEYLFLQSRSIYDGLQFIIANTWKMIYSVEEEDDFSAQLPTSSFRKMALIGEDQEPISADSLVKKYGIPESLAEFYSNEAPIFSKIRDFRDSIVHHGDSPETIFITEDGLAVDTTAEPYCKFDIWENNQLLENELAPLWPFVAYVVKQTVTALDRFLSGLLAKPLHLPYKLAEGYDVYMRGPHITNLNHLDSLISSDQWGEEFVNTVEDRLF